jgi:chromosome partitioning protein
MLTIAIANQKGGVGKTTLACNLGAAAHLAGKRTVILDLDAQGSALDWFAAREPTSQLAGLAVVKIDVPLTRLALQTVTAGYDVAILDAPPRLGEMTRSAAVAADIVLIPVQPSPYDLWACDETFKTLADADNIRLHLGLPPVRRVLCVNRAAPRTVLARTAPASLAEIESAELAATIVHQRIAFAEAAATGESVLTTEPDSAATRELMALYGELTAGAALRSAA